MSLVCPVCACSASDQLVRLNDVEAARHFVAEDQGERFAGLRQAIGRLWGGTEVAIRRCASCGFQFADPYVAGDSDFYALAFERADYPRDKWDFRRALMALDQHTIQANRVIEVGAGFGYFLDLLCKRPGTAPQIVATEYGLPALNALKSKGYDARACDIRELDCAPVDLICAFQVLEHLDRLDALAETFNRLILPGGYAILVVPNLARINFNMANDSLLDMPPNHIGGWTREAFERFGKRAGLDLIEFDTEPHRLADFVRQDIAYSYLRNAQRPGTLSNWSRLKRSSRFGKTIGAAVALARAPRRLPVWLKAAQRNDLGGSSFALLRKRA
jgi:SAM-dependent methyltransferase